MGVEETCTGSSLGTVWWTWLLSSQIHDISNSNSLSFTSSWTPYILRNQSTNPFTSSTPYRIRDNPQPSTASLSSSDDLRPGTSSAVRNSEDHTFLQRA